MLRGLSIRDMLLIDRLELDFQSGLNVLTGETGAGKSILLDSLVFVLGWRGRADLVREGAEQGEVGAVFDLHPDHPALEVLIEAGLPAGDELIIRRTNARDGRKQAWVNDRRCSGEVLRMISETLVELHGQHDNKGLLNARAHRGLLDAFTGEAAALKNTRDAWRDLANSRKAFKDRQSQFEEMVIDQEYLSHAVAELEDLDPQPDEEDQLDSERRLMQASERIRDDIGRAAKAMSGEGAEAQLLDAARWLEGVETQAEGRLEDPILALGRAIEELGIAQRKVDDCLAELRFNSLELEQTEERLFAIRALARKHNVRADELQNLSKELRNKLDQIESSGVDITLRETALKDAEKQYDECATRLSAQRSSASAKLNEAMARELAPLKMDRAVFRTEITPASPGPEGTDNVQFVVATNPGAPAGPLNKIASGGELSRFMLALKVCLQGENAGQTLIFDEIDRGVGGATADAVGRRLEALAAAGQVLVVTHSPQVAARGGHHWQVIKKVENQSTLSRVVKVTGDDRVNEVARMLAGDHITDEARAAANSLLAG